MKHPLDPPAQDDVYRRTTGGRLEGKVALITGAGSGIGRSAALRFAAEGAVVVAADLDRASAERAAADAGGDATGIELDVVSRDSVEEGLAGVRRSCGRLDVLVNNAGVTVVGAVDELTESQWDRQLDTNLKSVYLVTKAAWPLLLERGGSIVNTASIAGLWAAPADAAYCASKAGVIMLTKCLALDGASAGIRANCVCPGFTETPMMEGFLASQADPVDARRRAVALHPLGRLGRPHDIAEAMVYLASDEAAWVTGTALVVDGGLTTGIWHG